jgi:hypothetical protein
LFDAINLSELAERLFYEAETWLFENTARVARLAGPATMEPLTPGGLLVDGFDAWPAALLPYNPPYYPELVEGQAYERASGWNAWTAPCPSAGARALRGRERMDWRGVVEVYDAVSYAEDAVPGLRLWLGYLAGTQPFPAHPHLRWTLARAFGRAIISSRGDATCLGIPDFAPALRSTGGRLFPLGYGLFLLG